jgi:signal transduction histidine kinase
VANSGLPIDERDREAIFEQGFTRKPIGRGLGLYISRQVLRREGYLLEVTSPPVGMQAAFVIEAKENHHEHDDGSTSILPGETLSLAPASPERKGQ